MKRVIHLAMSISREMHALKEYIQWESKKLSERLANEWIDGDRVTSILKISKRTLQSMRDSGDLAYSQVNGKFYYKASDLQELLESKYLKKRKK